MQSPPLAEILTKLGDDWSIERNRYERRRQNTETSDDEYDKGDEAFHGHPFPSVLEWVTTRTGIPSDRLRRATLRHFDGHTKVVKQLCHLDERGLTRELWELLVRESPAVLRQAGLMPEKATDEQPLPPGTGKSEGDGGVGATKAGKRRGRKVAKLTIQRADFAKPLREEGESWPNILAAYAKKHPRDIDANEDVIRLAFERQYRELATELKTKPPAE